MIEGYFAVFGDVYELWPGASETIQRGAFSGVVGGDVRALINLIKNAVFARYGVELEEEIRYIEN